jgi:NADH dehydrogenase
VAASDIAYSLRKLFRGEENVDVKLGEVTTIDPATRTVTTRDGSSFAADAIVLTAARTSASKSPRSGPGTCR